MKFNQLAKYTVILSIIPAFFVFVFPGKINAISMLCSYPLIFLLILFVFKKYKQPLDGKLVISIFIFYNIVIFIRGIIDAKSNEDWSVLVSTSISIFLFLPLTIYLGAKNETLKVLFKTFFKYVLLLSFILLFKDDLGFMDFAHTVSPLYLLIIFSPYLNKKWRLIILFLALISFFSDLAVRSNLLNIALAYLISFTYYFRRINLTRSFIKFSRYFILSAPAIFLVLAITGVFNIFKISEFIGEYSVDLENGKSQDMAVDSRTGIYLDVILGLNKEDAFIWGLGGSGKTETHLADLSWGNFDKVYKEGRRGTESGMLNYAQWGGIIGVLIYMMLFIRSSYFGIYKSSNWLLVMIGLWVAFKGLFSFIEDRLFFSIYSLFIFISIGMCFNKVLRDMTDEEIKVFLRSLFSKEKKKLKIDK